MARGRFKPGQSGNPSGKPKGLRHRATRAAEVLLEGEAEALTRKAVELALGLTFTEQQSHKLRDADGCERVELIDVERVLPPDTTALRLCLERIIPPRRGRPISFRLPKVNNAGDLRTAALAILEAVAGGEVSPEEAASVAPVLEAARKAVEIEDLARRIEALEDAIGAREERR